MSDYDSEMNCSNSCKDKRHITQALITNPPGRSKLKYRKKTEPIVVRLCIKS